MNFPKDLRYTESHEWASLNEKIATIGITDFAQKELGDIIFLEFPDQGTIVSKGSPFGTIEAVKTVADIFAPVSGKIVDVNNSLNEAPEAINSDPYGKGWVVKIEVENSSEFHQLLTADDYQKRIA